MNDPYLAFDGIAHWGNGHLNKGYDIAAFAGDDGWLPHIEIAPKGTEAEYHFIRHGDEVGIYTPGYVISHNPPWVFSMPDEIDVPTWMPIAIERAGYEYDPIPNNERWRTESIETDPEQTELVEV